jgi:hypothetical protein
VWRSSASISSGIRAAVWWWWAREVAGTDIIFLDFGVGVGEFTVWIGQGGSEVEGCRGCGRCVSIVRRPIIPVLIPACRLATTRTSHNSNNGPLPGTPAQLDIFRRLSNMTCQRVNGAFSRAHSRSRSPGLVEPVAMG